MPADDVDAPLTADDAVPPEITWDAGETPAIESSPEGLYNDLRTASEDAHQKPAIEIERVPPPALTPPTRDDEDDPA